MFLFVPEAVLKSTKLNSDQKLLAAYLYCLNSKGKLFFGSYDLLEEYFGFENGEIVMSSLLFSNVVEKRDGGFCLTDASMAIIRAKL